MYPFKGRRKGVSIGWMRSKVSIEYNVCYICSIITHIRYKFQINKMIRRSHAQSASTFGYTICLLLNSEHPLERARYAQKQICYANDLIHNSSLSFPRCIDGAKWNWQYHEPAQKLSVCKQWLVGCVRCEIHQFCWTRRAFLLLFIVVSILFIPSHSAYLFVQFQQFRGRKVWNVSLLSFICWLDYYTDKLSVFGSFNLPNALFKCNIDSC